jgi:dTMP kinase
MAAETELLLFTASRAQLVREVILPSLREGGAVLADRFLDSTTVYQGVARKLDPTSVASINRFAVGDTLPDITFVLDLDPSIARQRLQQRQSEGPDRMESQPAAFYEAVRAGYQALTKEQPHRVRLLDASGSVGELSERIWREVTSIWPRGVPA